ncbi:cytochrome P450 [Fennellomyces sp. T-0311]|nr:cytochrome P450 [Fennellomyces sp. T-0311]
MTLTLLPTGGTAFIACAATLGLLALKYNDRAIFTEPRKGIVFVPTDPLVGGLFIQLNNKHRLLDYFIEIMEKYDAMTLHSTAIALPKSIMTIDPANVEYVLKSNFSNYVKGPQMMNAMGDLFGHGIFVANGEQWKYQRKTASLIFNVANFRDHFTEVFVDEFNVMAENIFDKKAANGKPVDFHDVMYKFTLDSFVILGFGKRLNALLSKEKVPFAASFDICQSNCLERFIDPFTNLRDALKPIISPGSMRIKDHLRVINDFAYGLISERREQLKNGEEYKDLLSRFMAAHNPQGEPLSDKELRDTVLNFIIAGRDTTAQALSWIFYNLMLHPRIEAKLLAEIDRAIPDDERALTAPEFYQYHRFYEVLRLYPSVPANVKVALEDDMFPDGSVIKKGDSIVWGPYPMARSRKIWGQDAREFKPERWIKPDGELRRESAGQWPAFHAGPRICLGQNLATLEALVAIILLVKRYKFSLAPNQDITYDISLTHPMKFGMQVFVERR